MNIAELIATENRDNKGVALLDGGRSVSYQELSEQVLQMADRLAALGVGPGVHVVISLRGGIEYIVLSLAVLRCGGVLVPVIETAGDEEIRDVLDTSAAGLLITGRLLNGFELLSQGLFTSMRPVYFCSLGLPARPDPRIGAMGAAFIRFSSGTTGASKGVVLSHRAILERTDAADKGLKVTRDDRVIWVLNMSFHFVVTILLFLRRGALIVICEEDFPRSFISTIAEGSPTFLYASPFHYSLLAKTADLPKDTFARVRLAVSTAMSLPGDVADQFYTAFGIYPSQAYGIIEVGLPCVNTSQDRAKVLSVGQVLPDYNLKCLDVDTDGFGRIFLKGPGGFDAYLKPFQTAPNVLVDGWFDTGDIGRIDEDGFLFITGRTKNVINFCGMKIFPDEVEMVLNAFPGVRESRVFGKGHAQYGQIVCAELVADQVVLDNLRLYCYRALAKYKVPKDFHFVDSLPKTASGKIRR